jgi:hypothetical protein
VAGLIGIGLKCGGMSKGCCGIIYIRPKGGKQTS